MNRFHGKSENSYKLLLAACVHGLKINPFDRRSVSRLKKGIQLIGKDLDEATIKSKLDGLKGIFPSQ